MNEGYGQPMDIGESMEYVGFWRRLLAVFIDVLTMLIPILLVSTLFRISILSITDISLSTLSTIDSVVTLLIWWLYFAFFNSSNWQATPGKRVLGIKVVDLQGGRISFAHASGRFFAEYLSALTFCIGYMMAGWTKRKRSLHDMIAKTYVIKSTA